MSNFEQHPRFRFNSGENKDGTQPADGVLDSKNDPHRPKESVQGPDKATFQIGTESFPVGYAATDGTSSSGGLIPGARVEDGKLVVPVPRLGPMTVGFEIDGEQILAGWDAEKGWAIHTDGHYIIGQTLLGEPRKFLLPDGYERYHWVKIPENYLPPRE